MTVRQDATAIIDRMETELLALAGRRNQVVQPAIIEGEVIER